MSEHENINDLAPIEQPPTAAGLDILKLEKVSYAYTKGGKKVIKDISYDFETGKVYAITGPSGAGKTTLLSLISGLTTPTEGRVIYDGHDLAKLNRYDYRSHDIGVIFQSFNLLPGLTVAENIELSMNASGMKYEAPKREIVMDLLAEVHLPEEYANERILHLSGGEQQRVAIARALSYDPKIIVADEPTGNLDLTTQDDIIHIFQELAHEQDRCVIIVTHSPAVAKASDVVFELAPLRHSVPKRQGAGVRRAGKAAPKSATAGRASARVDAAPAARKAPGRTARQ
ncbi:ATP-binding cassette domain-containing protein [Bifidobacterium sp. BRDM6]|uniref:ATP-binding cassette domain-containing protein n=1 Tax=Bifidobacterium choloepi TaxID=2614131 RepID=A0A6I5N8T0_9BIFI|nr:ABC transporter ATP-binding protein [Bifidobacterium choloepi]NEG70231.1 ATP-binding cassette domain-containing protein [Bifidobacterium choloepi]